ncbi:MAG TPA: hypothetical protein O0X39_04970 [Methanocorpusculum sp.]|nr:hypothetical protein [Methanocorpusculum sp.]
MRFEPGGVGKAMLIAFGETKNIQAGLIVARSMTWKENCRKHVLHYHLKFQCHC